MRVHLGALLIGGGLAVASLAGGQEVPQDEYARRRARLLERFTDGIVLLHARSTPAASGQHNFKQDASFFYFTGLASQPSAILALDGARKESLLFVPDPPRAFGFVVRGVGLEPSAESARRHGFDEVLHFDRFTTHLRERLAEDDTAKLYLDESRRPVISGNPEDLLPMAGSHNLWRRALEEAFPGAAMGSAASAIREMRWVKSESEIAVLREVARASASALLEGIRAVRPGAWQRETESAVVAGCIAAGAEGPSFWPWTMAGENAHPQRLVRTSYDYHHLNREMRPGELVRMDVGCDLEHYEGDVGRTVPVSGSFGPEQAEAWDLLIAAYRGGLGVMKAGLTHHELAEAGRGAVREAQGSLRTAYARRAAKALLEGDDDLWHVHGVGLEAGEERLDRLEAGSVIAFEPMISVGADAFYLEDMILITERGHEILTEGLPTTSEEIAREMRSAAPR